MSHINFKLQVSSCKLRRFNLNSKNNEVNLKLATCNYLKKYSFFNFVSRL